MNVTAHTDSQSEMAKVGAVNGASTNGLFTDTIGVQKYMEK